MHNIAGLDLKIKEMARRIYELREIENLTTAQMAEKTGVSEQEYINCENGLQDLNFAFIYRCALAFNVELTELLEGQSSARLSSYTVTRKGQGQETAKEEGIDRLAYLFEAVGAIEKEHEERYRKLLANVDGDLVFSRDGDAIWKCRNCGHIVIGKRAPELCPVCEHPKSYFEIKAENY